MDAHRRGSSPLPFAASQIGQILSCSDEDGQSQVVVLENEAGIFRDDPTTDRFNLRHVDVRLDMDPR